MLRQAQRVNREIVLYDVCYSCFVRYEKRDLFPEWIKFASGGQFSILERELMNAMIKTKKHDAEGVAAYRRFFLDLT